MKKIILLALSTLFLSSCASDGFLASQFGYTSDKYIPKDKLPQYLAQNYSSTDLKIPETIYTTQTIPISSSAVLTSFGMNQSADIVKAYNNYMQGNEDTIVSSDGYTTYPYDPYSRPIFKCSIGRVCTINLQAGEQIIGKPSLGDSLHWDMNIGSTGTGSNASQILFIKPLVVKGDLQNGKPKYFSTNLVIPTNKRVYNIGLLSTKPNQNTSIMNFYYPRETSSQLEQQVANLNSNNPVSNDSHPNPLSSSATNIDMNNINPEKYHIKVVSKIAPKWKPIAAFDDGHKTLIKLPDNIDSYQLPVVWVQREDGNKELSSSNTFKKPYYIIDGTYKNIFLFSGSDKQDNDQQVEISKD